MGRIRSIKQQITYAVRQSHTKGVSKRYEKLNNPKWQERGQSWSYQTLENRLETAKQFSKFMSENYSECGPIFQAKNKEVACRYVAEMELR